MNDSPIPIHLHIRLVQWVFFVLILPWIAVRPAYAVQLSDFVTSDSKIYLAEAAEGEKLRIIAHLINGSVYHPPEDTYIDLAVVQRTIRVPETESESWLVIGDPSMTNLTMFVWSHEVQDVLMMIGLLSTSFGTEKDQLCHHTVWSDLLWEWVEQYDGLASEIVQGELEACIPTFSEEILIEKIQNITIPPYFRAMAIEQLSRSTSKSLPQILSKILHDHSDPAYPALLQPVLSAWLRSGAPENEYSVVIRDLLRGPAWERHAVVQSIEYLPNSEALFDLFNTHLSTESEAPLRVKMVGYLQKHNRLRHEVVELLNDTDKEVRIEAMRGLHGANLGDGATSILESRALDRSLRLSERKEALRLWAGTNNVDLEAGLQKVLEEPSIILRRVGLQIIGFKKLKSFKNSLDSLILDKDQDILLREAAFRALMKIEPHWGSGVFHRLEIQEKDAVITQMARGYLELDSIKR